MIHYYLQKSDDHPTGLNDSCLHLPPPDKRSLKIPWTGGDWWKRYFSPAEEYPAIHLIFSFDLLIYSRYFSILDVFITD